MNSAANPETLADIVNELRRGDTHGAHHVYTIPRRNTETGYYDIEGVSLDDLADRIEAAAKRAHDIAAALLAAKGVMSPHPDPDNAPPPTAGDAAAMRKALESVAENLVIHIQCGRLVAPGDHVSFPISEAEAYIRDIRAALSAPPRNCDVGTAEEQGDRFARFCDGYNYCSQCPIKARWNFDNGHKPSCGVIWGQMPYEEGGAE